MSGTEEHAAGVRSLGCYPTEWGPPRGRAHSEERAEWVREHVTADRRDPLRLLERAELREYARREQAARLAYLAAIAEPPT